MSSSRMTAEVSSSSFVASSTASSQQVISGGTVIESSSVQQQSAISDSAASSISAADTRTAKLALSTNEAGKPQFQKTIEGCQVERKYFSFLLSSYIEIIPFLGVNRSEELIAISDSVFPYSPVYV